MEVERVGEDDTSEKADGKGKKYTREVGVFIWGGEREAYCSVSSTDQIIVIYSVVGEMLGMGKTMMNSARSLFFRIFLPDTTTWFEAVSSRGDGQQPRVPEKFLASSTHVSRNPGQDSIFRRE